MTMNGNLWKMMGKQWEMMGNQWGINDKQYLKQMNQWEIIEIDGKSMGNRGKPRNLQFSGRSLDFSSFFFERLFGFYDVKSSKITILANISS